MGTMSEIRTNAETIGNTAAEIQAEIPIYREMSQTIVHMVAMTAIVIMATCIIVIIRK
jgi:hypothetical protein